MSAKSSMFIVIRADASLDIGTGHVIRCLTLADELAADGNECRFICRAHPGNLIDAIRNRGYEVMVLSGGRDEVTESLDDSKSEPLHAYWLGTDWESDARETATLLVEHHVDWLIVDHYALDAKWEKVLRPMCSRLLVIDDLADRKHDCDLLIDQNLGRSASQYAALVPRGCRVLAGPQYALLRPEFAALREYSLTRRKKPVLRNILITMGGVDKDNATGNVLSALRDCPLPADCRITVVMGQNSPWLDQVRYIANTLPWCTRVKVNISDMAQVMVDSDLAFGAAGSTSWERCCLGLPTILLVLAVNQKDIANALWKVGAVVLVSAETLEKKIYKFFSDQSVIQKLFDMGEAASEISDGLGSSRVVSQLVELAK